MFYRFSHFFYLSLRLPGYERLTTLPLTILLAIVASAAGGAEPRPNVLILMADNWAWPHAGFAGDAVVKTPTIDAMAEKAVVFENAFCLAPSCAPARAAFLTGQTIHRLAEAASLGGDFPAGQEVFTHMLDSEGYGVGYSGKGWGPGRWEEAGWEKNPSGTKYRDFASFLKSRTDSQPFCFWFSSKNPHVPWQDGEERKSNMDASKVKVPAYLPDSSVVRDNILDYYAEVELFDAEVQQHLELLASSGMADNTIVIVVGDNGWQMPHGLAHVYDAGTHVPMIIAHLGGGFESRSVKALVNFDDLGPTILELTDAPALSRATGKSLVPLLTGQDAFQRTAIVLSRERHANVRQGNASYPVRAIRTKDFLYIRNFEPDRWPAGDPQQWFAVGPYGDVDYSYTKMFILDRKDQPDMKLFYDCNFGKRPGEELYDLRLDPDQIENIAASPAYEGTVEQFREQLAEWMKSTEDPRAQDPHTTFWDETPYYGRPGTPTTQRPQRDLPNAGDAKANESASPNAKK